MGLMQQANLVHSPKSNFIIDKKKPGLLNKVKNLSSYDLVLDSFKDFLLSINAERGGLLCSSEAGFSVLLLTMGFDLTTAKRFCPEMNLMQKFCAETNKFKKISGPELDNFKSFFSSHELDSLSALYISSINCVPAVNWYIVLADSLLNIQRKNIDIFIAESLLPSLLDVFTANTGTITSLSLMSSVNQSYASMKTHVESAFNSKRIATLAQISFSELFPDLLKLQTDIGSQSVFFAIAHRIARQAGASNIIYINKKFNIRVILFTTVPIDTEMYFFQLMKPLEKIFGAHRISRIQTTKVGTSSSVSVTMDYLTGEV